MAKLAREQEQLNQYINKVMDDCSCAMKMATSVVTTGLCVLEARDVKTELVRVNNSNDSEGEVGIEIIGSGWMKHAPSGREEGTTARDWDPRTH